MADFDRAHVEPGGPPHRYPGGPLAVTKLSVGPFDNNAYLLADPETREALLVDAANEAERLLGLLDGVSLVGVVTTHRHPDHIQALGAVLEAHDVWNGAHPADADDIASQVGVKPDRLLEHGAAIRVGRFDVEVLHTPGHTAGSICFKLPSSQVLTGDALFPGGVGRTEGRAAFQQAIGSAERHLLSLAGETHLSPGHGDDTEVARELPQLDEWKARGW
ncbi:MAG TPA: MBL fold metallo-hydrolase [Actinomycetes bacterium]|jgi:glyoxylase-like metal-dependent hydrolase (beta-lactamase superfamily II)|nr:MBL fold metallo-hydrolase [Actinomycetes bacterium]